jgi:hypothetical protein
VTKSAKRKAHDTSKKAPAAKGPPLEVLAQALGDYSKPTPISTLQMAFPANLGALLPPTKVIPEDFRDMNNHDKWHKFQDEWFFFGLKELNVVPKPGIDPGTAIRHLQAVQSSFEPSHEHKRAAVAWLASLWFEEIQYELVKKPGGK